MALASIGDYVDPRTGQLMPGTPPGAIERIFSNVLGVFGPKQQETNYTPYIIGGVVIVSIIAVVVIKAKKKK